MLVLTRRPGETLTVGDDVTVTVLAFKNNRVRIGISAPKEVAVHREEIYQRIVEQKHNEIHTGNDNSQLTAPPNLPLAKQS